MATISSIALPTPGTVIIKQDTSDSEIITHKEAPNTTRLTTGVVIAIGAPYITDYGISIPSPVVVGDFVVFLTYETKVDRITIDGEELFHVAFKDIRSII